MLNIPGLQSCQLFQYQHQEINETVQSQPENINRMGRKLSFSRKYLLFQIGWSSFNVLRTGSASSATASA